MIFTKYITLACCGTTNITFKIDQPITRHLLERFKQEGFEELEHFTKNGMLYIFDKKLIISGSFGSTTLTVKLKSNINSEETIINFEELLKNI